MKSSNCNQIKIFYQLINYNNERIRWRVWIVIKIKIFINLEIIREEDKYKKKIILNFLKF